MELCLGLAFEAAGWPTKIATSATPEPFSQVPGSKWFRTDEKRPKVTAGQMTINAKINLPLHGAAAGDFGLHPFTEMARDSQLTTTEASATPLLVCYWMLLLLEAVETTNLEQFLCYLGFGPRSGGMHNQSPFRLFSILRRVELCMCLKDLCAEMFLIRGGVKEILSGRRRRRWQTLKQFLGKLLVKSLC